MTVQDAIEEIKSLINPNVVTPDSAIFIHLKFGLTKLYSRFDLLSNEYLINLVSTQTEYNMPTDCIKVEEAYAEPNTDKVYELAINDKNDPLSIFTPRYNIVQVPNPSDFSAIDIIYKANHPALVLENTTIQELELPPMLLEILYFYVMKYMAIGKESRIDYSYKCNEAINDIIEGGDFRTENLNINNIDLKGYNCD